MSEVKRYNAINDDETAYTNSNIRLHANGEFVLFADYLAERTNHLETIKRLQDLEDAFACIEGITFRNNYHTNDADIQEVNDQRDRIHIAISNMQNRLRNNFKQSQAGIDKLVDIVRNEE